MDCFKTALPNLANDNKNSRILDTSATLSPQYDGVEGILLFAKAKRSKNFNMVVAYARIFTLILLLLEMSRANSLYFLSNQNARNNNKDCVWRG